MDHIDLQEYNMYCVTNAQFLALQLEIVCYGISHNTTWSHTLNFIKNNLVLLDSKTQITKFKCYLDKLSIEWEPYVSSINHDKEKPEPKFKLEGGFFEFKNLDTGFLVDPDPELLTNVQAIFAQAVESAGGEINFDNTVIRNVKFGERAIISDYYEDD